MKNANKIVASILALAIFVGVGAGISFLSTTGAEALSTDYLEETFDPKFTVWENLNADTFLNEHDEEHGNYALIRADARYLAVKDSTKIAQGKLYYFEIDYKISNTRGSKYIYWGKSNGFRLYFTPNSIRATDNKNSTLAEGSQIEDGADTWHHVKVKCDFPNNMYTLYLDDSTEPYIEWPAEEDASLMQIIVRLEDDRSSPDAEPGYFAFDNVRLYDPDVVATATPTPAPTPSPTPVPTKEPALFPDTANTSYEKATNAIGALGIITGYEDGTFGPDKNITRAEFATIVARSFNLTEASTAETFSDVPADHWAKGYIGAAKNAGIINGFEDGTFKPNDNVTEEQAVKMIVAALGYTEEATAAGGYPDGYIKVASDKKINADLVISGKKDATRGRVAIMLYNSLDVAMKGKTATIREMNTK